MSYYRRTEIPIHHRLPPASLLLELYIITSAPTWKLHMEEQRSRSRWRVVVFHILLIAIITMSGHGRLVGNVTDRLHSLMEFICFFRLRCPILVPPMQIEFYCPREHAFARNLFLGRRDRKAIDLFASTLHFSSAAQVV